MTKGEHGGDSESSDYPLNEKANLLINAFETGEEPFEEEKKISVNPVVSEVASWYERIRNAMDYRADEVILRAAIERILRRRILLLGGNGKKIAEPLVRELIWARYFPDGTIPEAIISQVASSIDLHLTLRTSIFDKHKSFSENKVEGWIFDLMSSDLEQILNPNREEDTMRNFMFQTLREQVKIEDDKDETRDAQIFISVCKSFAKDDTAFLRSHLFRLFFGQLSVENIDSVAVGFMDYYKETERQLSYKLKDRIYSYVLGQTSPFLIMRDLLNAYKGDFRKLLHPSIHETKTSDGGDELNLLKKEVFAASGIRYNEISAKVRRAIVRSVIFILLTKAIFALTIEGTYENIIYGGIQWSSMLINVCIPPLLMILVGMFIKTPGRDNSQRIYDRIVSILFDDPPKIGVPLTLRLKADKTRPLIDFIFTTLWLGAFFFSFGLVFYILTLLDFNIVNKAIFMFFFAIVSFLTYRINQMANQYTFKAKMGIMAPLVDFLFMPIIRVGRKLTEGIAQLNLLIFILDFIIETPFKGVFAFFEQWFLFLRTKREELG